MPTDTPPELIGRVRVGGADHVALTGAGDWVPLAPGAGADAELLNAIDRPARDWRVGDHHLPWGYANLNRAAGLLKGEAVAADVTPLPEGAVS